MSDNLSGKKHAVLEKGNEVAIHPLTPRQMLLLKLSDKDIEEGRLIPYEDVMKNVLDWLKQMQ